MQVVLARSSFLSVKEEATQMMQMRAKTLLQPGHICHLGDARRGSSWSTCTGSMHVDEIVTAHTASNEHDHNVC